MKLSFTTSDYILLTFRSRIAFSNQNRPQEYILWRGTLSLRTRFHFFYQIHVGSSIRFFFLFSTFLFCFFALQVNKYMQITLEFYFSFLCFILSAARCWAAHRFYMPCSTRSNFGWFVFVWRLKMLEICRHLLGRIAGKRTCNWLLTLVGKRWKMMLIWQGKVF